MEICGPDGCQVVPLPAGVNRVVDLPLPATAPPVEGAGGAVERAGDEPLVVRGEAQPAGGLPAGQDIAVDQPVEVATFGYPRDTFWPSSTIAFLIVGVVLTLLSAQLVAPTRRFRLPRMPSRRRSAPVTEPGDDDGVSAESNDKPITESPA
jgi:hypothetical protein